MIGTRPRVMVRIPSRDPARPVEVSNSSTMLSHQRCVTAGGSGFTHILRFRKSFFQMREEAIGIGDTNGEAGKQRRLNDLSFTPASVVCFGGDSLVLSETI